ncbi:hypothetical protein [Enterococcus termitis]|uniref:hypothetical protein n=1 Tax=Enterococcus termitis TaxID=332950 RepID=UPI001112D159|nr:hypothetical protein [Enterococcus termitis]
MGEAWRLYFSEIIQKEDLHENEEQLEEQEQPPRMIVRDFVGGGGSSGGGGASISGIDTRVSALERWRTGHDSWAGGLSNRVSAIENWISNWALPQFNSIWSRLGNLETWKNGHDSWANNLSNRVTSIYNWAIDQFNVQNNRWSDQYRKNNDNWGHWKDQWSKNDDNYGHWKDQWNKNNDNWGHWKTQWSKNDDNYGHWKDQWNKNNDNWGHWKTQWALNDSNKANWESQWKKNNDNWEHWKTQWALNTKQATTNQKFETFITNQNTKNINLQTQIDNLKNNVSWSDVGIITALVVVKDSIDNFRKMFEVDDLVGLNAYEGIFTRMIKSQFIALRNDLRDLFKEYFDVEESGGLFTPTGVFAKFLADQMYRLRYTIIAGFGEIEEVLKLINTDTLGIRNSLNTVNLNLTAVNNWLKAIFDKPVGTIVAPPFDFNRLEQILKSLNFGNVTNEAGTNLWDFLKSLIDNLGDILGKGLDGIFQVLKQILEIFDKFLDTILHLIIPKNLDFLDSQWGKPADKIRLKFSFIFDSVDSFKSLFGAKSKKFEDLDIQLNGGNLGGKTISLGSVKLPVSHLNTFLQVVRPIVSGFVLLWFLIDMYKWIHERNAVVE